MRILIVEDNQDLSNELRKILSDIGFAVDCTHEGKEGSFLGRTTEYDLIIADISLPEKTGKQMVEEIRKSGKQCPILIMSGNNDTATKANLLRQYADDYLTKPFDIRELLARVYALLRRPRSIVPTILTHGDISLQVERGVVTKGKKDIYLTRKEFALLHYFMRHPQETLSREHLLEHVWDMNVDPFSNTVEVHVRNIRRKLGESLIETVPSVGYRLKF